jgi:hypothetical protein
MTATVKQNALPSGKHPKLEHSGGIIGRFRYWQGASGQRYMFTEIDPDEVADYPDTVLLLVEARSRKPAKLAFLGEVGASCSDLAAMLAAGGRNARLRAFIHFLADNSDRRRQVIADLAALA